ncbi:MAG TPA: flagellar hook-associated protein FlgK [Ruminiclostridium sp.]
MTVGFSSYEIARSGLSVSERALAVTGQNISNVNTTGYVRQQAIIESSAYITEYGKNGKMFQYGLGADIQETRQIRHTFLDNIYRRENTTLGYSETRGKTFQDVEAILNDTTGDGLQNVMNQFWDSWQELTKAPESLTMRALVRQSGQALVYQYNHIGTQLDKLQVDLNSEIQVRVGEVNNISSDIAKLNYKIASQEINGDTANDFRDQRNVLVDRLSKLCDAEPLEMQDGQIDVTLGGYYLVSKGVSRNLYVESNAVNGDYYYPMLEGTNIEINIKSGILKGLLESRGEVPGIKGSYANGNPKEKVDITFAIDTSAGTGTGADEYLSKLKASIGTYVDDLKKTGADFNIRFVNMNSTSSVYGNKVYTADDIDEFINNPADTTWLDKFFNKTTDADGKLGGPAGKDGLLGKLEALQSDGDFRADATKLAYIFTNKSVDGDGGTPIEFADAVNYINRLNAIGMKTSVVTEKSYYSQGTGTTATGTAEIGWAAIAAGTGGKVFDIGQDLATYSDLLVNINSDMRNSVNATMGDIPTSKNIVSDLKIKMNAMVNAMVKEVNYLQKTGYTLDGKVGADFFEPMDDMYPMQMGNLKLSDALLSDTGLNNITASDSTDKGGNSIARKIANLRDTDILQDSSGEVNIDEFYKSIVLDLANGGFEANNVSENQSKLVQAADGQRTAISGVSMDEEMSNMMKFKFAYDASARTLNIIDSMMETVIKSMGMVGR